MDPTAMDPTDGTPDTTSADTTDAGTTVAAADAIPDETSQDPVGVMDETSETPEEPLEAPQAIDVASADVTSTGATTDTDPVTDAAAATLDSATDTASDVIDVSSDVTADAAIGTIPVEAVSGGHRTLDTTVAAAEATTDVAAMIADASTVANDVVETPVAADGTGAIDAATSEVATAIAVATGEAVTMVENLSTVADSAPALTPEISADVTAAGDVGSDAAAGVVEAISETAVVVTDLAAEATASARETTQTAAREATAITNGPSAAIVEAVTDATWATSETVATEASATVSSVAPLETATGTTSTTSDAAATVSDTSSEVMTGVEDALVFSNLAAQTIVDSTTTITSPSEGAGPDGTTDAAQTLSEAASAVIAAVSDGGAPADTTTVPNEATETDVFSLDPASPRRIKEASGRCGARVPPDPRPDRGREVPRERTGGLLRGCSGSELRAHSERRWDRLSRRIGRLDHQDPGPYRPHAPAVGRSRRDAGLDGRTRARGVETATRNRLALRGNPSAWEPCEGRLGVLVVGRTRRGRTCRCGRMLPPARSEAQMTLAGGVGFEPTSELPR